ISDRLTKVRVLISLCEIVGTTGPRALEAIDHSAILQTLPTSVRQFNGWTSVSLSPELAGRFEKFDRNANVTLRADPHALRRVEIALGGVKLLIGNQAKRVVPEKISFLRRKLQMVEALKEIAEKELRTEMKRTVLLNAQVLSLQHKAKELERETKASLRERDAVILKLKTVRVSHQKVTHLNKVTK
ncbi:MAG: hypothetical protein Q8S01_06425, partial [Ignavibacteria bacterium]|nr:hypothetical protein [Ignavibacteria bacterium]